MTRGPRCRFSLTEPRGQSLTNDRRRLRRTSANVILGGMKRLATDTKGQVAGVAPDGDEPFEIRYLKYVAITEGCGCAERVIQYGRAPLHGDSLRDVFLALRERIARAVGTQPLSSDRRNISGGTEH